MARAHSARLRRASWNVTLVCCECRVVPTCCALAAELFRGRLDYRDRPARVCSRHSCLSVSESCGHRSSAPPLRSVSDTRVGCKRDSPHHTKLSRAARLSIVDRFRLGWRVSAGHEDDLNMVSGTSRTGRRHGRRRAHRWKGWTIPHSCSARSGDGTRCAVGEYRRVHRGAACPSVLSRRTLPISAASILVGARRDRRARASVAAGDRWLLGSHVRALQRVDVDPNFRCLQRGSDGNACWQGSRLARGARCVLCHRYWWSRVRVGWNHR